MHKITFRAQSIIKVDFLNGHQVIFRKKSSQNSYGLLIEVIDEGCGIDTEDPKPLLKVLNYLINYLKQLTKSPLEISLDLHDKDCLLSLMAYSDAAELPEISEQLDESLKLYNASKKVIHEKDKYIQIKLSFVK